MSVNRPQTISSAIAILTLSAAVAWGQQGVDVRPERSAVASSSSVSDFKLALQDKLSELADEKNEATSVGDVTLYPGEQDSLLDTGSRQLVNKDGYFLPKASGSLWKDMTTEREPIRVARRWTPTPAVKPKGKPEGNLQTTAATPGAPSGNPLLNTDNFSSEAATIRSSKFRLRIGFDALLFQRGRSENTIFATEAGGNDWSFSDFDFSEGDPRYFIQYMGDDLSGFEFTFFDFNSFSSTIQAGGEDVVPVFFQGNPAGIADSYNLEYTSRLKQIEINSWLRHNTFQRSGYGIRHINLDENFNVRGDGSLLSRTDNDLWGLTRMWERRRPLLNRMTAVGGIDAGLFMNRAKINVDTENIDDSSEAKNLAGSLGFNLGVEYRVADHVTLRFGYEGFGLFGVALGSTQSLQQNIFDGLNDPELGSIYFGGFNIGAIATF